MTLNLNQKAVMIVLSVMFIVILYFDYTNIQQIRADAEPWERAMTIHFAVLLTHVMLIVMFIVLMNTTYSQQRRV